MKNYNQSRYELIIKLRNDGRTYKEIGSVIGVCGGHARGLHLKAVKVIESKKKLGVHDLMIPTRLLNILIKNDYIKNGKIDHERIVIEIKNNEDRLLSLRGIKHKSIDILKQIYAI